MKSTTRFPMSLRRIVCVDRILFKRNNAKFPKFKQQSAITSKRYEIGYQLLLITNRKSHTGFRLVPTSVTLNDLERYNSPYFVFFPPNSIAFQADYVTVVEDVRKISSPSPVLPLLAKTNNAPCSVVSLR